MPFAEFISDSPKSRRGLTSVEDIDIDQIPRGYFSWAYVIKSPRSL